MNFSLPPHDYSPPHDFNGSDDLHGQKVEGEVVEKSSGLTGDALAALDDGYEDESFDSSSVGGVATPRSGLSDAFIQEGVVRAAIEQAAAVTSNCSISADDMMRYLDRYNCRVDEGNIVWVQDRVSGKEERMSSILEVVNFGTFEADESMLEVGRSHVNLDHLQGFPDPRRAVGPPYEDKRVEAMTLEDVEQYSVQCYMHEGESFYADMNLMLREGEFLNDFGLDNDIVGDILKRTFTLILLSTSFLNKRTDLVYNGATSDGGKVENVTFRRVRSARPERLEQYEKGKEVCERGFSSASEQDLWHGSLLYVVRNRTGRSVKDYANDPSEKEVLYKPGTVFRSLMDPERLDNGTFRIILEEVEK